MLHKLTGFFSRRIVRITFGILISAASLYLAVRGLEWSEIAQVLSRAAWGLVVLALISTCLNNLLKALRWKFLLDPAQGHISYYNTLWSFMVGQMFNYMLPARTGELSRVYIVGEMGVSRAFIVGTLFLEKVLDMVSYALLIVWMLVWFPRPDWLGSSGWAFVASTFLILVLLLVLVFRKKEFLAWIERVFKRLPAALNEFSLGQVQAGLKSFSSLEKRGSLVNLSMMTFGIWGLAVLTNFFVFRALDIEVPASAALLVSIILQAGIALPAVPGKFGVFEYACILALSLFGISQEVAFSYGLLLHAIVLAPVVISGLYSMWRLGLNQEDWKRLRQPYDQMGEQT